MPRFIRRLLVCWMTISPILVQAGGPDTTKFLGPIVSNVIVDKYVPAYYQNIGGDLCPRFGVYLGQRLLQNDSATLLSGFSRRPRASTSIGEHVGKFLFFASKAYAYRH